jgi:hypothetical protein
VGEEGGDEDFGVGDKKGRSLLVSPIRGAEAVVQVRLLPDFQPDHHYREDERGNDEGHAEGLEHEAHPTREGRVPQGHGVTGEGVDA